MKLIDPSAACRSTIKKFLAHAQESDSVEDMLDPAKNVEYAAVFPQAAAGTAPAPWTLAVARYHAGPRNTPAQKRYVCAVIRNMVSTGMGACTPERARVLRVEVSGTLQAAADTCQREQDGQRARCRSRKAPMTTRPRPGLARCPGGGGLGRARSRARRLRSRAIRMRSGEAGLPGGSSVGAPSIEGWARPRFVARAARIWDIGLGHRLRLGGGSLGGGMIAVHLRSGGGVGRAMSEVGGRSVASAGVRGAVARRSSCCSPSRLRLLSHVSRRRSCSRSRGQRGEARPCSVEPVGQAVAADQLLVGLPRAHHRPAIAGYQHFRPSRRVL